MATRPFIEYYMSFISSWSYIGSRRIRDLAQKHDAQIIYKPVDVAYLFSRSGGLPVKKRAPERQAYRLLEMERWAYRNNLPLVKHPKYHPAMPSLAHRVLLAAIAECGHDSESIHDYVLRSHDTVWVNQADIADPSVVLSNANAAGLDGKRFVDMAYDKELVEREESLTREAVSRQYFGLPTYVYRGEPFWGQDRIDLLDEVIRSGRPPIRLPST